MRREEIVKKVKKTRKAKKIPRGISHGGDFQMEPRFVISGDSFCCEVEKKIEI